MIQNILITLSDTELISIADQLSDDNYNDQSIYNQIISKGNNDEKLSELIEEMNSDNFRGTLPRLVAKESSSRLSRLLSPCFVPTYARFPL